MESKVCKDCKACKPVSEFYRLKKHYQPRCKVCHKVRDRIYKRERLRTDPEFRERQYEKNRLYRREQGEGFIAHQRRKREKHTSRYFSDLAFRCAQLVSAAKRRAAKKGLEFDLDAQTLEAVITVQGSRCVITGTPFELSASEKYFRSPTAPSLDRKDSSRGYTWDNIQVVASWYNLLKNEWDDEDAKSFIRVAHRTLFGER